METQWQDCNISNRLEHVDLIALEHIDNMSRMYIFFNFQNHLKRMNFSIKHQFIVRFRNFKHYVEEILANIFYYYTWKITRYKMHHLKLLNSKMTSKYSTLIILF